MALKARLLSRKEISCSLRSRRYLGSGSAQLGLHLSGMTDVSSRLPSRPSAAQSRAGTYSFAKRSTQGKEAAVDRTNGHESMPGSRGVRSQVTKMGDEAFKKKKGRKNRPLE